ncbi:MAG: glycosyltransferase [Bacteroidota bacterium]
MLFIIYSVFSILLTIAYIVIVQQYRNGWKELSAWNLPPDFEAKTSISVLIPARNEAENIVACLNSILQQSYPNSIWEVIVLDDHSTDETADLVKQIDAPNIRLLHLADFVEAGETQSFKKKAIEVGVAEAKGDLIVTTDADCIVQGDWLTLIASFYQAKSCKFIAAPVNFHQEQNVLERFQSLDFLGMMGTAGGGIQRQFMRMCNGANLAYEKAIFYEVSGFEGINEMASGDDMLLMQKVAARYPEGIGYLKNLRATTYTTAKPTFTSFFRQRLRWATKSSSYQEAQVTFILALVFFFCCDILFSFFALLFWTKQAIIIFLFSLIIKALMDYLFLSEMSKFFQRQDLMRSFLPSFFMHIGYIIFVGFAANLVKQYEWKGRKVR